MSLSEVVGDVARRRVDNAAYFQDHDGLSQRRLGKATRQAEEERQ
jgi:hypothetical protein